jgi:hypothetical protein
VETYLSPGLGNTEEGKCQRKKTEGSEEDVSAPGNGLEHVGGDKADDATAQAVLDVDNMLKARS